jgi:hypothetical protein
MASKTERTVPSSGTPRNIEGRKFIMEWDIAIEIRKTARKSVEKKFKRYAE